jgi:glutathione S-transferase
MHLYYSPFACSLAPHIALKEIGLPFQLTRVVSLQSKLLEDGSDFRLINPKGCVPTLRLDDGTVLTEAPCVLQYIADRSPTSGLLPAPETAERYQVLQWLSFVGSEIHKSCWWYIFAPGTSAEMVAYARAVAERKFDFLNTMLVETEYLVGSKFTVADAHLTWALTVAPNAGLPLNRWPAIDAYWRRQTQRPSVQDAFAVERAAIQS